MPSTTSPTFRPKKSAGIAVQNTRVSITRKLCDRIHITFLALLLGNLVLDFHLLDQLALFDFLAPEIALVLLLRVLLLVLPHQASVSA